MSKGSRNFPPDWKNESRMQRFCKRRALGEGPSRPCLRPALWGGKCLHHIMANLIRKICTKLYENRSRFVTDMTKRFWCVFRFANPKWCRHIIQVKWKTFTFLCDKFTKDNMCQILSESVGFCRRYDIKQFGVFFSIHSVECYCNRQFVSILLQIYTRICWFDNSWCTHDYRTTVQSH